MSCNPKKKPSLAGEDPVDITDFIRSFALQKAGFEISDSLFSQAENDSLLVRYKIFTQFVPDSVLTKYFGRHSTPRIYMMKRVEGDARETYLFVKAILGSKKMIFILCFDQEYKFVAALPLLVDDGNSRTSQVAGIDRRFTIYKNTLLRKPDGTTTEGKEVYIFNKEAGKFILIMTEALDDRIREVINPIDTLGKKHKYAGDYVRGKMNIISIRDAYKPDKITFFIHLDQNDGECTGELKGVASFIKPNQAVYRQSGNPCVLQFLFTSSSVTLKETGPCGAYHGSRCSFDVRFPKKKILKTTSGKH